MRSLIITLAVCLAGGIAHADIEYVFNIQPFAPLADFSFSFTAQTYVGEGASLTFAPFIVETQTYGWVMTQGLASGGDGAGCFAFGTAVGVSLTNECGTAISGPGEGTFYLLMPGSLPTAPGTYGVFGQYEFGEPPDTYLLSNLTGTLTVFRAKSLLASDVSAVPEPKSILLLGSILVAVGWSLRRRLA